MAKVAGHIHSVESFGAVDGPGIRYVLFVQGCPLQCLFCHNPDTWYANDGKIAYSDDIVKDIISYKNFIKTGGVTISGGEPLMQPDFVLDIIEQCRRLGIHTAIDTSGAVPLSVCKSVIDAADLILLDIKSLDNVICKVLTGKGNENALAMLDYCEKVQKPVWIRHVMVPGYTLQDDMLIKLADYLKPFKCIEKVELLAFHKMGEFKWQQLKREYLLADTKEPTMQEVAHAKEIFTQRGLKV